MLQRLATSYASMVALLCSLGAAAAFASPAETTAQRPRAPIALMRIMTPSTRMGLGRAAVPIRLPDGSFRIIAALPGDDSPGQLVRLSIPEGRLRALVRALRTESSDPMFRDVRMATVHAPSFFGLKGIDTGIRS
jgi:hypothetical protein